MQRMNKKMTEPVTAVILAGGRALRMGGGRQGPCSVARSPDDPVGTGSIVPSGH